MSTPSRRPDAPGEAVAGPRADGVAALGSPGLPASAPAASAWHIPDWRDPEDGQEAPAGPHGGPAPGLAAEVMDRITHRLSLAGFRLVGLRRRLHDTEDRLTLTEASDELDEAIAEIRRLALIVRYGVND